MKDVNIDKHYIYKSNRRLKHWLKPTIISNTLSRENLCHTQVVDNKIHCTAIYWNPTTLNTIYAICSHSIEYVAGHMKILDLSEANHRKNI